MLKNIERKANTCLRTYNFLYRHNSTESTATNNIALRKDTYSLIDMRSLPSEDLVDLPPETQSPLEKCTEDITHIAPYLKPTFNFAAYINKSESLQQLLNLGVNLHKLEKKVTVPPFIMGLDFERDVKKYILFFHDLGVSPNDIGAIITKNPYILKESIENLKVRINYLLYKKFDKNMILRIVHHNPFWLMFSTERIDRRLGFFQNEYELVGDEVRKIACKQPRLITYSIKSIKLNHFALREEMGFSTEQVKYILLRKPNIFMKNQEKMLNTYEYIANVMNIPIEIIAKWPEVLTSRQFRVKQRHLFLKTLEKAQYDPKLPNYVSLLALVSGSDADFAVNIAKSSLQGYNAFLKTL